ncbi:hypothetical protein SAMN05216197_10648 [Pseudomonas graminis]|uniref:Uncharacterized protein n=1 Tax=Pseudomonas graminis TaxID=158627 RepID=A0A1I0BLB7_9PSED|nr:hypothetical protein SAMN05216197_10648 [Pseudomonas graminis]
MALLTSSEWDFPSIGRPMPEAGSRLSYLQQRACSLRVSKPVSSRLKPVPLTQRTLLVGQITCPPPPDRRYSGIAT